MSHTKEPWSIGLRSGHNANTIYAYNGIDSFHDQPICNVFGIWNNTSVEDASGCEGMPDARRIVACVNACAGISTDVLEAAKDGAALLDLVESAVQLTKQRDELLAALEFYANPTVYEPDSIGRRDDITFVAKAAIAKVQP